MNKFYWHYESDGDEHAKTHYITAENPDSKDWNEIDFRIDFDSKKKAKEIQALYNEMNYDDFVDYLIIWHTDINHTYPCEINDQLKKDDKNILRLCQLFAEIDADFYSLKLFLKARKELREIIEEQRKASEQ